MAATRTGDSFGETADDPGTAVQDVLLQQTGEGLYGGVVADRSAQPTTSVSSARRRGVALLRAATASEDLIRESME